VTLLLCRSAFGRFDSERDAVGECNARRSRYAPDDCGAETVPVTNGTAGLILVLYAHTANGSSGCELDTAR